jgi:predicted  nucleic acid-binding Zn-ribbon protein
MVPEISHRCASCGASIRDFGERAMFCPECGKPIADATQETSQSESERDVMEPAAGENPAAAAAAPPNVVNTKLAESDSTDSAEKSAPKADGARHSARERTRETLHRASSAARGAIEDNVKRVEKIHHVSTVMLEEAHYDPSLRFVLVALGLFIVFVILLVLSKVMG